jgi:predicted porin
VSYNTPTFSGFNASLSYAPQSEGAAAGANTDAKIYGVTGRYTTGALRAQFDWAKNKGATATGVERTEIDGVKLGVGWAYAPGSQVSFVAERLKRENSAAIGNSALAGDDLKANVYLLNWEHMIGPWQLLAQYGWTSKVKGLTGADTGNTQVKGITLGGKYFLSKRTGVYVTYNKITNQSNAFADYGGGIGMTLVAANEGADPRVIAVGVMHNF